MARDDVQIRARLEEDRSSHSIEERHRPAGFQAPAHEPRAQVVASRDEVVENTCRHLACILFAAHFANASLRPTDCSLERRSVARATAGGLVRHPGPPGAPHAVAIADSTDVNARTGKPPLETMWPELNRPPRPFTANG